MKLLLPALLFPIALNAQDVEPVLSKDYQDLIHNDSLHQPNGLRTDTTNFKITHFWLSSPWDGNAVKRIRVQMGLAPGETKHINLDLKADIAGKYKGKAGVTYLYYMPEYKHWNDGVEIEIK